MQIDVTGARESTTSILTPTKILQGNELQDKLGSTLGATIGNELGVSQTGYAAGASRPVMRGLEGARVQILQNGLAVGDLSALSPDHATANALANARQIEILRGAAALLYGTGSSGGIVNVVNDRILSNLPDKPTGALRTGYESVSNGRAASGVVEASHGSIALHVDTAINNHQDYRFPGNSALNGKTDYQKFREAINAVAKTVFRDWRKACSTQKRHLHKGHTSHEAGRCKTRHVADHTTTNRARGAVTAAHRCPPPR